MKKTPAQLDREIAAALIAGDAELEGKFDVGKKIRKQEGAKSGALLGYTTSAKPVYARPRAPGRDGTGKDLIAQAVNEHYTNAKFPGWTQEDHEDASRLHREAAETALASGNQSLASNLKGWGEEHARRQSTPTTMTKATHAKVRAMLRRLVKDEWNRSTGYRNIRLSEHEGEAAVERAIRFVTKSLGPMLGGVKLAALGGLDAVEVWNQTGEYNAPEFVVDLATGSVS